MSSMSNVAGLSKWIRTLPNAKSSVLMIIILSFITGVLLFLLQPVSVGNGLEDFFYGGAFGFVVFGLPAIIVFCCIRIACNHSRVYRSIMGRIP